MTDPSADIACGYASLRAPTTYHLAVRPRVLDALDRAMAAEGGPVTAEVVRQHVGAGPPLTPSARGMGELLRRIARLGTDDRGVSIHVSGRNYQGQPLWTLVPEPRAAAPHRARVDRLEALAAALRAPGDRDALDVVERVLLAELARRPGA